MSVKAALFNYLTKYAAWNEKQFGYRPCGRYVPDVIYDGPAEKGYDYWKPVEIKETFNFKPVEEKIGFIIHDDLKEFLTSYYYFFTSAKLGEYYVRLRRSIPKIIPQKEVHGSVSGMKDSGFDPQYIDFADATKEIGGEDDYLILFHNQSGKIYIQDHYTRNPDERDYLAESMETFLNKLSEYYDEE